MYKNYTVPVSVKGVVVEGGKVWLRKNERNEWEIPGGKMDEGEQPETTIARELKEELGFDVSVGKIIQAYLYKIDSSNDEVNGVLVITYLCNLLNKNGEFETTGEAGKAEFNKFSREEVKELNMPDFYKESIFQVLK